MKRTDIDQERYTTAMMALGFAYGLLRRVTQRIPEEIAGDLDLEADMAWLKERVERVMQLNSEAEGVCSRSGAGKQPRSKRSHETR